MKPIDQITEQKIRESVRIEDVFDDHGCVLHRNGNRGLTCLCPFHEDRELGNFSIDTRRNIFKCFACGASGDWIKAVALFEGYDEKKDFNKILRYGAGLCNIYIDDSEPVRVTKYVPRAPLPELKMLTLPMWMVQKTLGNHDKNPLLAYLESLPWKDSDRDRLHAMEELYMVGTTTQEGRRKGWTIWWYIDENMVVRTGKTMAYRPNGHRDKTANPYMKDGRQCYYTTDFIHTILNKESNFKWDTNVYEHRLCYFGEHLLDVFPVAEVCIVESEKTALICSAFCDPQQRLWLACGGLTNLNRKRCEPLIRRNRNIVVYPDYDGQGKWEAAAQAIGYERIVVVKQVLDLHTAEDGDKADIADIMVRLVTENDLTRACALLGVTDEETKENLGMLIEKLDLTLI